MTTTKKHTAIVSKEVADPATVGARLRWFREQHTGLSADDLATLAGIDKAQYLRFERDERVIKSDHLASIADACKVNLHWLLTGRGTIIYDPHEQAVLNQVRVQVAALHERLRQGK